MRTSVKKQVQSYFTSTSPKARAALKKIRAAIRSAAPGAEEAFSYRIPAFRLEGRPKGYEMSKGTVRLPLAKPIPVGLVKKLVRARMAEVSR